jgi:hypothetical protein
MNEEELVLLRKFIHDLNNRVGTILATAEILQMDSSLSPKASERSTLIETKALEIREIIRHLTEHYVK